MNCYRCGKIIDEAKSGLVCWNEVEREPGKWICQSFEVTHKLCKPRVRFEVSWELDWFKGARDLADWLRITAPRALEPGEGRQPRVPDSFVAVTEDLIRYLAKNW